MNRRLVGLDDRPRTAADHGAARGAVAEFNPRRYWDGLATPVKGFTQPRRSGESPTFRCLDQRRAPHPRERPEKFGIAPCSTTGVRRAQKAAPSAGRAENATARSATTAWKTKSYRDVVIIEPADGRTAAFTAESQSAPHRATAQLR